MISHPVLCNRSSYAANGHPFLNSTSRTTTGSARSTPFTTRWTVAPTLTTSPQENFQNRALYYHTYKTSLHGRQRATAVTRTYFLSPRPSLAETTHLELDIWTSCIKHGERNIRETTKKRQQIGLLAKVQYTVFMRDTPIASRAQGVVTGSGRVGSKSLT